MGSIERLLLAFQMLDILQALLNLISFVLEETVPAAEDIGMFLTGKVDKFSERSTNLSKSIRRSLLPRKSEGVTSTATWLTTAV